MPESFVAAIDSALQESEPAARINSIKTTVSRELESIEHGIQIHHTQYFNSTIAPDMIITWPREKRERFVFLRASSHPEWLQDDIELVGESHPIIVTLKSMRQESEVVAAPLQETAQAANTLVADPLGVAELNSQRGRPVDTLLSQAVLRGGRGLLDHDSATAVADVTARGFEAAEHAEVLPTRAATDLLATFLAEEQAGRMTRVLQSVWEGNGGRPTDFPGHQNLAGRLTDDDLIFLVDHLTTEDTKFWRRIGGALTLEQLSRLTVRDPSQNLQHVVSANADRLFAKAARLVSEPDRIDESDQDHTLRWTTARGCLVLRGEGWSLYLASNSVEQLPSTPAVDGISVSQLQDRSRRQAGIISHLELDSGDRIITYASKGTENIIRDKRLISLARSPGVRIHRATLFLRGTRKLICDFTSQTCFGHTSAIFPLEDITRTAMTLFAELSDEHRAAVERLVTAPGDIEQLSLDFDI